MNVENGKVDILFVSNFSEYLNATESEMIKHLPSEIECKILTYKNSKIANTYSYERFLEDNYNYIKDYNIFDLNDKFKGINFNLTLVAERFLSDYYGLSGVLGHKNYSFDDINFIMKSWVLFLDSYIPGSKIVFSGYADNLISHLTFMISEFYNINCISFGPKNVINHETNYLISGVYAKPCDVLMNGNKKKESHELLKYIKNYNMKNQISRAYKDSKGIDKPLLGLFSANIKKISFWKYVLFGYEIQNQEIKKYLELDRTNIFIKLTSYRKKVINIMLNKLYMKSLNNHIPEGVKSIYFPLQVQPEASTSVTSPYFMNLLSTVEYISKSLPLGYLLIVKEHPAVKGIRNISFYKQVNALPNVKLISTGENARELMKNCELTIGFGGTTLLESIYLGKKILIFEDSFYSNSKLVRKLKDFRNLNNEILDFINLQLSAKEKELELENMLNYYYQRGFPRYENFEKNMAINLMKIFNELK